MKKVFVSGCFDLLHSGHVAFFEEAAKHGELYVGIGSDNTINSLKGRKTVNTEQERLYMIKALKAVTDAWVNTGSGLLDFLDDIKRFRPDIFFVNEDGHTPDKEKICQELGIEYMVSKRIPHGQLPVRSTTALRKECMIPYRIDIAGGWMDQPYVSKYHPGSVLTVSIEPDYEFNDRSGMSTSTRKKAIEMWQTDIPQGDMEKLAKTLFCFENPPGKTEISGSQDSLGIVLPGLNRLDYDDNYWPYHITSIHDEERLTWIENHIYMVALSPRRNAYNVLDQTDITRVKVKNLADAADRCWKAILDKDIRAFGSAFRKSFEAQIAMFPNMVDAGILEILEQEKGDAVGWKLSGAGGGGYLIFVAEHPEKARGIKIRIRRKQ
ncbi:MAG: adenylyltransferase/cytidyltransferase family protein [Bacteroidales bacterium]|jgi:cytidyltransferase-like protein|nr:adenylyltransferase/cytidyltransferase family protein [Bacteroidales bacterium]